MTDQSNGSVFSNDPATQPNEQPPQGEQQGQQQAPAQPAPPASSDNMFADQLASITNERGEPKYKDAQTALDALKHSQQYIPQLKQENETLRAELEQLREQVSKFGNIEETLERLSAQQSSQEQPPAQQGMTPEQIQEMLEQQLTQREQQRTAQQNAQRVSDAIAQRYGDKAREAVAQRAQEMGTTAERLGQLAAENPDMVLALFDAQPRSPQGKPTTGSSVSIPPINPDRTGQLEKPERSLLQGANSRDQTDYMAKVRRAVYERHGISDT